MKTNYVRRYALAALVIATSLTACKKDKDPAPATDLADRISGQYTLAQLTVDGKIYAAADADLKGGVSFTRQSASGVSIQFTIMANNTKDDVLSGTLDGITLTDAGSNEVDLSKDGNTIGRGSTHKLTLTSKDQTSTPVIFTMTR